MNLVPWIGGYCWSWTRLQLATPPLSSCTSCRPSYFQLVPKKFLHMSYCKFHNRPQVHARTSKNIWIPCIYIDMSSQIIVINVHRLYRGGGCWYLWFSMKMLYPQGLSMHNLPTLLQLFEYDLNPTFELRVFTGTSVSDHCHQEYNETKSWLNLFRQMLDNFSSGKDMKSITVTDTLVITPPAKVRL